jgi:hypothetical protein
LVGLGPTASSCAFFLARRALCPAYHPGIDTPSQCRGVRHIRAAGAPTSGRKDHFAPTPKSAGGRNPSLKRFTLRIARSSTRAQAR